MIDSSRQSKLKNSFLDHLIQNQTHQCKAEKQRALHKEDIQRVLNEMAKMKKEKENDKRTNVDNEESVITID